MSINRKEIVYRHNPILKNINYYSPLTVGNGEFAFTTDITGFQTFSKQYENSVPLCTQSQWAWHTTPVNSEKYAYEKEELTLTNYNVNGRNIGYPTKGDGQEEIFNWLRTNPHRLNLAQIGLDLTLKNGSKASIADINSIEQKLDLWTAIISSNFTVEGEEIIAKTCCHPKKDILAFSIKSSLLQKGRIKINIDFPYGSPENNASDWDNDDKHTTKIVGHTSNRLDLLRALDNDKYFVSLSFSKGAKIERTSSNSFVIEMLDQFSELECVVSFTQTPLRENMETFQEVYNASISYWESYWNKGGFIDFSKCTDERALELERRVILSQYLTAIQCAGSIPPQETGLTFNSWYGKFHLEMHWWHAAHFPLWGRKELLEKSIWWYQAIMPKARDLAKSQGYRGVRWPKMLSHDGIGCPSKIAPLLIWQQPHPIYFAELSYRENPCKETLEMYKDIVLESAEFMASFVEYDKVRECYNLGPAIIPAQENHAPEITLNPTYELEYWRFGLTVANKWRERLSLPINKNWEEIASNLAPLPIADGVYLAHENCPDTYSKFNFDHPSMLGAMGLLPGVMADKITMQNTLDKVFEAWNFEDVWGWDFPMMAMTAARLNKPELAITSLLYPAPKNEYLPNGHNKQGDKADLPLYLPGNGGLLIAVGMMAAGWDGCENIAAPGFPKDGKWDVVFENLSPMI
jgi:hypothetical protein